MKWQGVIDHGGDNEEGSEDYGRSNTGDNNESAEKSNRDESNPSGTDTMLERVVM
jgi:hypothetical protein